MTKTGLALLLFALAITVFFLDRNRKPQPVFKRGEEMTYHVTKRGTAMQSFATFNEAIGAVGNVVDEFPDIFNFVFDGDGEALPYSLTIGEDSGGWFTNYVDDNPDVTHFTGATAMEQAKAHVKHIDDLAWGKI